MKGVIVTYPGTLPSAFIRSLPADLKVSYDGFDPGKLPTLSVEGRLFSYSAKTLVITNTPARVLWGYYKLIECQLPHETFVTSMVNGAHRLNFFNEIWAKVSKEKGIKVLTIDQMSRSPLALASVMSSLFSIDFKIASGIMWPSHKFSNDALSMITNICGQGWANLKGGNNG